MNLQFAPTSAPQDHAAEHDGEIAEKQPELDVLVELVRNFHAEGRADRRTDRESGEGRQIEIGADGGRRKADFVQTTGDVAGARTDTDSRGARRARWWCSRRR